ncbi:MAG: hypothetical protein QMD46_10720 [Methanomicrobiales archaeon]|nr:hypothetical protein [Methanomicrobiales archaeon]MDI6876625.1 hypothetical protein [Methanomicrobiales archaeon]
MPFGHFEVSRLKIAARGSGNRINTPPVEIAVGLQRTTGTKVKTREPVQLTGNGG